MALLSERHRRGLCILMSIKEKPGSCGLGLRTALSQKGAVVFYQSGTDLGHPVWWPFLSSSDLIRCNSIRDTVQAQHKHIPRQHNGHHPRDGEP